MFDALFTRCWRSIATGPCLQIYGKAKHELAWRSIDVFATRRRDLDGAWPLLGGACTTWSSQVIAVGWDFARLFLAEQQANPVSRELPLEVSGGRLRDATRRHRCRAPSIPSASEIMAHECGHTGQAARLGVFYLPVVGSVTLFREGQHWWNFWENDASANGLLGGIARIVLPIEEWPSAR
jgi:hypothetical protein